MKNEVICLLGTIWLGCLTGCALVREPLAVLVNPEPTDSPVSSSAAVSSPSSIPPPSQTSITSTGAPKMTLTTGSLDIPLSVRETGGVARENEPVTSGIPIPRAVNLIDLTRLRLLDANGKPVAVQFTPLARWGGMPNDVTKPVRWLLLDFQADVPANGKATWRLVDRGGAEPVLPTLVVSNSASTITINTGVGQFTISKSDGRLTTPNVSAPIFGQATDARGTLYTTTGPVNVSIALEGAMRVSIQVQGAYRAANGTTLLNYTNRYWFYGSQPIVRLFHTVENNNLCPLDEYEQPTCHDIGTGGSVSISDLSLIVPASLGNSLQYRVGVQGAPISGALSSDLTLYQDSSGTDSWNLYPTFKDWDNKPLNAKPRMQAYVSFRGYRTTLGNATIQTGNQAAGWLSVTGSGGAWTIGVRDFWQNFPKALRASPDGALQIGLFPDEFGGRDYAFNLRAGEHKTHEILLAQSANVPVVQPIFAQAPPELYVNSGALGLMALPNKEDWNEYEQYLEYQLTTAPQHQSSDYFKNLFDAVEHTDFYGIFDYGDWPIDYEGFEVSPLNPKYNNDYGMWLQWARTGDARWFQLALAADRHSADIDILHNLHTPRHWGDGIVFGHSGHDEPGFTNPHRNRNSGNPDTAYGVLGMFVTYYLTGYEKARDSAVELSDCIEWRLRNDEQLCGRFPECNGTGYAMGDGLYENGTRPAANSLAITVAAYRATGNVRYLQVADAIVEWGRPKNQPFFNGPIAGDERTTKPWMLNMYLRALADYIEVRNEFGLPDTYDAKGSFLGFAKWLGTYALINLKPIDTGARAAYPYEWWFDGRKNVVGEDNDNGDPSINNWLLLGADGMAYAYRLSGDAGYLETATRLFRAGVHDPWYEGDQNAYGESKETANSVMFGHIFLNVWARGR